MSAKFLSVLLLADITSRRCQFIVCIRASVLHKHLQCGVGRKSARSIGNCLSLTVGRACNSPNRNWSVKGLANFEASSYKKQSHSGTCPYTCSVCPKGTVG